MKNFKGIEIVREKLLSKTKGITLIALVVTIVVLLILAGVTINLIFSNGGIFDIANQAKIEYEIGALKDRINNVIADWSIERAIDPTVTVDDLWDKMVDADIIDNPDEDVAGPEKEGENDKYELTTNEGYIVEIIISPDGNVSIGDITQGEDQEEEDEIGGATDGLKEGNIIASEPIWSNGVASITLSKGAEVAENLSIQYQVGDIVEENWTTGEEVTGLYHNNIVYARLTDGTNYGRHASVTILDEKNPQNAMIELSTQNAKEGETITATITHIDNESGVDITKCKWVYNTTQGEIGTEEGSYTGGNFNTNEQDINLTVSTAGTYYLHVLTIDKAGNKTETISDPITVTVSNTAPVISSVSLNTKSTNSITVNAQATDADNNNLTYTLYISTSESSGFTAKATSAATASGTQVTLTASELNQYTYYYYYVTVTDGEETVQGTTSTAVRTCCPGNTKHCSGGKEVAEDCSRCGGSGRLYKCHVCSYVMSYMGDCLRCSSAILASDRIDCTSCGGEGEITTISPCEHGMSSSHYYCEHGNTSQHD